eukprot:365122-Chlamydomonas_euryale.AAC.21
MAAALQPDVSWCWRAASMATDSRRPAPSPSRPGSIMPAGMRDNAMRRATGRRAAVAPALLRRVRRPLLLFCRRRRW